MSVKIPSFTLAEVLITLGIIGIVASMTMPTLISSVNGVQHKTAFKKALSTLAQAIEMSVALDDYDLSKTISGTNPETGKNGEILDGEAMTIYSIFRKHLNIAKVSTGTDFNLSPKDAKYYPIISDKDRADYTAFAENHGGTIAAFSGEIMGAAAPLLFNPDGTKLAVTIDVGLELGPGDCFNLFTGEPCEPKDNGGGSSPEEEPEATVPATNAFVPLFEGNATTEGSSDSAWGEESTMLFVNDGLALIFDNTQSACRQATANESDNYCFGFIDINGQKGPNRVVECDNGSQRGSVGSDDYACTVSHPSDIYPIAMFNQSIIPASAAARAVLYSK